MNKMIIQIVSILVLCSAGIGYIANLNSQIEKLTSENTTLLSVAKHQDEVIQELTYSKQKYIADINRLDAAYKESKSDRVALEEKLKKHDLDELARLKPGLISKAMNNGTKNVFIDINKAFKRLENGELSEDPEYKVRTEF